MDQHWTLFFRGMRPTRKKKPEKIRSEKNQIWQQAAR